MARLGSNYAVAATIPVFTVDTVVSDVVNGLGPYISADLDTPISQGLIPVHKCRILPSALSFDDMSDRGAGEDWQTCQT